MKANYNNMDDFFNKPATEEFIDQEINDKIWSTINYIEDKYKTRLIGERLNINRCKADCLANHNTYAQVSYGMSEWRKGILKRYNEL